MGQWLSGRAKKGVQLVSIVLLGIVWKASARDDSLRCYSVFNTDNGVYYAPDDKGLAPSGYRSIFKVPEVLKRHQLQIIQDHFERQGRRKPNSFFGQNGTVLDNSRLYGRFKVRGNRLILLYLEGLNGSEDLGLTYISVIKKIFFQIRKKNPERQFFDGRRVFHFELLLARYRVYPEHKDLDQIGWHWDGGRFHSIIPIRLSPGLRGIETQLVSRPFYSAAKTWKVYQSSNRINEALVFDDRVFWHRVTPGIINPSQIENPRAKIRDVVVLGISEQEHQFGLGLSARNPNLQSIPYFDELD